MKRRNFIALTALGAAAVSIPNINCMGSANEYEKKLALPQSLSRITDENEIIAIGKAYGNIHKEEYTLKALEEQLQKNKAGNISATTPVKELDVFLEKNVNDDLDQGNTIVINGWVLSVTEARQCALFSLTH
jgi:hypothetical protein